MTDLAEPVALFETHRRELTGYCYRMLGSLYEAEDAVQETMVRAWRSVDRLEGRRRVQPWLYRIATNVCLDDARRPAAAGAAHGPGRRRRRATSGPARRCPRPRGSSRCPTPGCCRRRPAIPAARSIRPMAVERESIRLAFVAALQHLPARQRAVLILRDVLRWRAAEVAELLDTTVVSVNSALRRARATLAARGVGDRPAPADAGRRRAAGAARALRRRLRALRRRPRWWRCSTRTSTLAMPPYDLWLQGHDAIVPVLRRRGARVPRLTASSRCPPAPTARPAFGLYRTGSRRCVEPFGIQVVELVGERDRRHPRLPRPRACSRCSVSRPETCCSRPRTIPEKC